MIKNCLGLTLLDFKKRFMLNIDLWILKWLIKYDCGAKGAAANGLANYPAFTAFAASQGFQYLDQVDAENGRLTGDSMNRWLEENIDRILELYNQKLCEGKTGKYDDATRGRSSGKPCRKRPTPFPRGLSKSEQQKLLKILADGVVNGASNGKPIDHNVCGPYVIGDGSGTGIEGSGEDIEDDDGPLAGLSEEDIDNLKDDDYVTSKCFEVRFRVFNYIVPEIPEEMPIMTESKVRKLKKLHREILLPIYRFYYGDEDDISCNMRITGGLTTMFGAVGAFNASLYSRRVHGECASFSLVGITPSQILDDVTSGRIGIDYGFVTTVNGFTISLPFSYEGKLIKNLVLSTPTLSSSDIAVSFSR